MNHLLKAVEILKEKFKHEIYDSGEWSYNLWSWTVKIDTEEDENTYNVVAYRAKDNVTDWSDFVVLPSYQVQFELTYE